MSHVDLERCFSQPLGGCQLFVQDSTDQNDELQDGVTKDAFIRIRQEITRLTGNNETRLEI